MEECRLQELRKSRELVVQREELKYLKNLVEEQERTIHSLEQDVVQQNMVLLNSYHLLKQCVYFRFLFNLYIF